MNIMPPQKPAKMRRKRQSLVFLLVVIGCKTLQKVSGHEQSFNSVLQALSLFLFPNITKRNFIVSCVVHNKINKSLWRCNVFNHTALHSIAFKCAYASSTVQKHTVSFLRLQIVSELCKMRVHCFFMNSWATVPSCLRLSVRTFRIGKQVDRV
jgi:hypothetical protein